MLIVLCMLHIEHQKNHRKVQNYERIVNSNEANAYNLNAVFSQCFTCQGMAGAAAAPKEIVDFSPSLPFITSYSGLVSRHTFVCFLFNVLNFNRNIYWSFFAHFGSKKLWYLKVTGSYPELCINGLYFAVRACVFNSYHRLQCCFMILVMQRRGKWCNHVISIHQTRLDEVKYR